MENLLWEPMLQGPNGARRGADPRGPVPWSKIWTLAMYKGRAT